jgi:hypothetical protein
MELIRERSMNKHTAIILTFITLVSLLGNATRAHAAMDGEGGIPFADFKGLSTSVTSFHRWIENPMNKTPPTHAEHTDASEQSSDEGAHPFAESIGLQLGTWSVTGEQTTRSASFAASSGSGDVETHLGLVQLSYDFNLGPDSRAKPYVSAGAGIATHEIWKGGINTNGLDADDRVVTPAWQVGGGMNYRLTDQLWFNGDYRFTGTPSLRDDGYNLGGNDHQMRMGLTYEMSADRIIAKAPAAGDRAPPPPFAD